MYSLDMRALRRSLPSKAFRLDLFSPLSVRTPIYHQCSVRCSLHTPIAHAKLVSAAIKENSTGYRLPPKEIADIVDAPSEPLLSFSPDRTKILQLTRPPPNPPITELARPELKLAGLRIDPESFTRSRMGYYTGAAIAAFTDDLMLPAAQDKLNVISGIPPGMWLNYVTWSPDSKHIAFTLRSSGGPSDPPRGPLELWIADAATGAARKLLDRPLNAIFEDYDWIDDTTIIASVVPEDAMSTPPAKPLAPLGPRIEDNSDGKSSQARTYPDLLRSQYDEQLFEHYCSSELVTIDVVSGACSTLSGSGKRIFTGTAPSPDGRYLLASWLERPFSYAVPCGRFPKVVQLWTRTGEFVKEIASLPLAEDIPIAFNACRRGPRSIGWRDDKPAELSWIEAQDGGDPSVKVSPRDVVYCLDADEATTAAPKRIIAQTDLRCGGVAWGDGELALLYESEWKTRRSITWIFSPDVKDPVSSQRILFDRNYEDSYTDPGSPASRRTERGTYVLAQVAGPGNSKRLLMQGSGASPEGNRPFLDILDLDTKESKRIWQSSPPFLEGTSSILSDLEQGPIKLDGLKMLATRESTQDPPQFYIKSFKGEDAEDSEERKISSFPHPYPTLRDLQKEIIKYKRADGVDLNGTLFLPPKYNPEKEGPLPCLLWAYPREYKSKEAAGQLRKSPHSFSGIGSTSPLLWLARRYAILDGPGFPILGEGEEEPNDTFLEQLTSSAAAAVEELVQRGVAERGRIAVGGHSYGAFMAANLLAHAPELFACGIARSGAFNRTLTPFGFQAEERSLWQAPETYMTMSPFMHADKIKKPLLLIHGEEDNNTGTFTQQSERMYSAIKGHGGIAKLVVLPHESHGYSARESIMHCLYEMDAWLARYCCSQSH